MALLLSTGAGADPDAARIVSQVAARFDAIRDYRVDISLTIKGPSVSVNGMPFRVYYKKPDKVHIEARSGFAVVPQGTYFGNPMREFMRSATPVYLRAEKRDGRDCDVLKIAGKGPSGAPAMVVWIDRQRSVVVATEMSGPEQLKSEWKYATIPGGFYMPAEISVEIHMYSPGVRNANARAVMKLGNYVVNKGIDDKVFRQETGGGKGRR